MITFEPESPWYIGQHVTFHEDGRTYVKVVESVEHSEDGSETQYSFVSQRIWDLRQAGVRPYIELDQ